MLIPEDRPFDHLPWKIWTWLPVQVRPVLNLEFVLRVLARG